jgi:threonine synthase
MTSVTRCPRPSETGSSASDRAARASGREIHLRCGDPNCATRAEVTTLAPTCPACGELFDLWMPRLATGPAALRDRWRARRLGTGPEDRSGVWRFRELLPAIYGVEEIVTLGEGNVPLLTAPRSAAYAGVDHLLVKHLGWNPTGSFKDTGMTVAVTHARHLGAERVACASTGNTAAAVAAYAARAGLPARVFVPRGATAPTKIAQTLDYGAVVEEVDGTFDDAFTAMMRALGPDTYAVNSVNPFRLEGQKTAVVELLEQLDWIVPEYLVVPGGNLGNTAAVGKGLEELLALGLIDRLPRLVVVQAEGANPLARAWRAGSDTVTPVTAPRTAATAIQIGAPRSWRRALHTLRLTDGLVTDVTDAEIDDAKAVLGREGIGCEPASATTLAGVRRLVRDGAIPPTASIVALLTGHTLKDPDYIVRSHAAAAA